MTNYQYLLKHPHSKKHLTYLEGQIKALREYKPRAKQDRRNTVQALIILYESLFEKITIQGA